MDAPPWHPDTLYLPARPFSRAELSALVTDGVLVPVVLEAHVLRGRPVTRAVKVAALEAQLPPHLLRRGVLGRLSAAWFYDCAGRPSILPVLLDKLRRTTMSPVPEGLALHQVTLGGYDVHDAGPVHVTTPLRTAVDLALHVPGQEGLAALEKLMHAPHLHCPPPLVQAALESFERMPGRQAALLRVRRAARAVGRPLR
ncbi:type IV toxin-antitoxin system AbiEi family antitoxin [uncultured Kocuria sp.]|uniref:type IV toxin-antitoxin system AbiEi family antitoxin n=1 Tax=uncultured Kocuria sp. TaxID=259305 RepID=UPI002618CDB1|nr:type IV toxin-antitoxin system AbiEi family antitoxin [uncultured Kocuria sp.]